MSRILVTGASTGLGLLTAASLAEAGHEIVLHARNPHRTTDPNVLHRMHGVVYGDLADQPETRRAADEANRLGPFDAVIHNAGVIDGPDVVAVNVVAPFTLTALMDRPARIIVLSSSMHRSGSPDHLPERVDGRRRCSYSDSKLLVTVLAMGIARRWPDVLAHAVDPGWVPTRMGGRSAPDDLTEGHRTQEWLAASPEADIRPRTGGYWYHHRTQRPHPATLDTGVQDQLIGALEARTGLALSM